MKKTLLALIIFSCTSVVAQDVRPSLYDLLHTNIEIHEIDFTSETIRGVSHLTLESKVDNLKEVTLDLLVSEVDSVLCGEKKVNTVRNKEKLTIELLKDNSVGDSFTFSVYYHGKPAKDPSNWGGFYFTQDYAFNMGVGFKDDPHTYGRAWYPTIDHFEERSTYSFAITTDTNQMALCNGTLISSDTSNSKITWNWKLQDPIPSYLVSMAVAPYTVIKDKYKGLEKDHPIWLACKAKDTTKVKGSFINLKSCAKVFEEFYGPHKFEKIGFTIVPFNSGAMEHATNIAYPLYACDGTTNSETLMAHEFAHHWWGDNITCKTALDMWINEGWASYSEALFTEQVYGTKQYRDYVRDNHKAVLHLSHVKDNGPRAIYGIPHDFTYGSHVYDKGADVAHTLRWFMGDKDFKRAVNSLMSHHTMQSISSIELRDSLQKYTSRNMTQFFENWVFEPGFPHLEIIETEITKDGSQYKVRVGVEQRTKFTWKQYNSIPTQIGFYDKNGNLTIKDIELGKWLNQREFTIPFDPAMIVIDPSETVSDAITEQTIKTKGPGFFSLSEALMDVTVNTSTDSSIIRVEHHWVEAKRTDNTPSLPYISKDRYWSVDGVFSDDLDMKARIAYDGRTPSSASYGYLDHKLIISSEDNLVLMYRAKDGKEWTEHNSYKKLMGSPKDGFGYIDISGLKKGQYCLAFNDNTLNIKESTKSENLVTLFPNPASEGFIQLTFPPIKSKGTLRITDTTGRVVKTEKLRFSQNKATVVLNNLVAGKYILTIMDGKNLYNSVTFSTTK